MSIEEAIDVIGYIVTAMAGWFGTIFNLFTSNGILLLLVGIPLVAFVLGIIIDILQKFLPKKE